MITCLCNIGLTLEDPFCFRDDPKDLKGTQTKELDTVNCFSVPSLSWRPGCIEILVFIHAGWDHMKNATRKYNHAIEVHHYWHLPNLGWFHTLELAFSERSSGPVTDRMLLFRRQSAQEK